MVNRDDVKVQLYDILNNKVRMKILIPDDVEKELFYYNSKITPTVALYILTTLSIEYNIPLEKIKPYFTENIFCFNNIVEFVCTYSK